MGVSINAVGTVNLANPNSGVAGAQRKARFDTPARKVSNTASHTDVAPESQAGTDAGALYQVPDAVTLQLQLQTVLGGSKTPAHGTAVQGAVTTGSVTKTGTAPSSPATSQAPSTHGAAGVETKVSSANSTAATAAASGTASVKSEEDRLLTTLQSLGLSPSTIQTFMNTGDLLAEISPALFQAFFNAVTNIAHIAAPAQAANSSGSASPAATTTTASTSNTTPGAQVEFASVQVSAAEVQTSPASSGQGASVSTEAAAGVVLVEAFQTTQSPSQNSASTAPSQSSNSGTPPSNAG
jgi:hypothetical protein